MSSEKHSAEMWPCPKAPAIVRTSYESAIRNTSIAFSIRCTKMPKVFTQAGATDTGFYNCPITKPVVCARIVAEMGSHLPERVPVQSHNSKGLEKSLCDFTGTIFV